MATLFSDDFTALGSGENLDNDGQWSLYTYAAGGATTRGNGSNEVVLDWTSTAWSGARFNPSSSGAKFGDSGELRCRIAKDTSTGSNYAKLIIGIRMDYWGNGTTPTAQTAFNEYLPARGWYLQCYPGASAAVWLYRGAAAGNNFLASSSPFTTSWTSAEFRVRCEKIGSDFRIRSRVWEGGGSEPGTWQIDYTDTAPGIADDPTTGHFGVSYVRWAGDAQAKLLAPYVIGDLVTATNLTLALSTDTTVSVTPTAPATPLVLALSTNVTVSATPTAPAAGVTDLAFALDVGASVNAALSAPAPAPASLALALGVDQSISTVYQYSVVTVGDPVWQFDPAWSSGLAKTRSEIYNTPGVPGWATNTVDIFEPAADIRAVILWIPGGGFITNNYTNPPQWIRRQVLRGAVLASVEHRTSPPFNAHPWDEGRQDLADAVAWAQAEWPGEQIIIAGHSAGAFYAAHVGAAEVLPWVSAAGFSDWDHFQTVETFFMTTSRNTLFSNSSGVPPAGAFPDFNTSSPPAYLIHGQDDTVVVPSTTRRTADWLNSLNVLTHLDEVQGPPSGPTYTQHEPIANMDGLDAWLETQGFTPYDYTNLTLALGTDATVSLAATTQDPGVTDLVLALGVDVAATVALSAPTAGTADLPLAFGVDVGVAVTPTAPAPAPTGLVLAVDVDETITVALTAPPPAPTPLALALSVDVTVSATPTAPAAGTTDLAFALDADVTLVATPTAPAPAPTDLALALGADVTVVAVPTAPTAGVTDLVLALDAGIAISVTPTAPAPAPTSMALALGVDTSIAVAMTAPAPGTTDLVLALATGVAVVWTLPSLSTTVLIHPDGMRVLTTPDRQAVLVGT